MKIGLDLSVIQTPHRMRGIGATAINFINNMPDDTKIKHTFVLFLYPDEQEKALEILNLEGLNYETRTIKKPERVNLPLPSKLKRFNSIFNSLRDLQGIKKGDSRINKDDLKDLDSYLQFDQMQAPPKLNGLETCVILYDLIPYVLESNYLWNYKTGRVNGDSRKSSLRKSLLRKQYIRQVKLVCSSAHKLIAISEHTKKDFIKYVHAPASKIKVIHLGVSKNHSINGNNKPSFEQYTENSWGYFQQQIDLTNKPFILFVGGADPRRKLIDLVAAFNNLRAQGNDVRLVLAGDSMMGPKAIPVQNVQKYLLKSSYIDDIAFLGFVTDEQREWLYENALAMVYPSVYEGFGLPVLEAMRYGTPVITYNNSSIYEIAKDSALYAQDALTIKKNLEKLLQNPQLRNKLGKSGKEKVLQFTWENTVVNILNHLKVGEKNAQ
jgi:glycosyltransferase involved in cell wall biosynthesis